MLTLFLLALIPTITAQLTVTTTTITLNGLISGGSQEALVSAPTTGTGYPLIVYMHGMTAGGPLVSLAYKSSLEHIASGGFIVVAPKICPTLFCPLFYRDQLTTISVVRTLAKTNPILSRINFTNVGICGHSMGAGATVISAGLSNTENGIKAAVALHPYETASGIRVGVPTFFATGTLDTVNFPIFTKSAHAADRYPTKTLVEISGITHFEPNTRTSQWDPYVVAFFRYHLIGDQQAHDIIYGTGPNSMCKVLRTSVCSAVEGKVSGNGFEIQPLNVTELDQQLTEQATSISTSAASTISISTQTTCSAQQQQAITTCQQQQNICTSTCQLCTFGLDQTMITECIPHDITCSVAGNIWNVTYMATSCPMVTNIVTSVDVIASTTSAPTTTTTTSTISTSSTGTISLSSTGRTIPSSSNDAISTYTSHLSFITFVTTYIFASLLPLIQL